ncbi:MAG: hypothetical protein JO112_23670 [Planctomycetes bacterium]|nr:hypothetical protein [Planctomycetota bacterium]
MRRPWMLALALCLGLGCAGEGQKSQWQEFWKDVRGDNMKMHDDMWEGRPAPAKDQD